MPRIRTIKPDAFMSDSLSRVSRGARWTFAGLWTYCDDEGRARYDTRLIKAALYPLDDEVSLADLAIDLDHLEQVGCICRYEDGGKRYMHVPAWPEHQKINRPTPSKLPACTATHEVSVSLPDDSLSDHGAVTEPSLAERKGKEQGKGSTERAMRVSEHESKFDDFWDAYPRKVDKGHARKAWTKVVKDDLGVDTVAVIEAAMAFAVKAKGSDPKFIPHAATWLNGQRWLDEDSSTQQDATADEWFRPFTLPECPPEIADDPQRYAGWVEDQRAAWRAEGGR